MGISREQALDCFRSDDLLGVGMEADAVRRRLHPEGVVTYAITCNLREPKAGPSALNEEIAEASELGITGVRILRANKKIEPLEEMIRGIRRRFPSLTITGLSSADVLALATGSGSELRETIARLHGAGLDSLEEDDIAQPGCDTQTWINVHRGAHGLDMSTVAAMTFAAGESIEQRVDALELLRKLQEETGGLTAFVPVAGPAPGGRDLDGATAVERLKMLAIARMFLDTVENVRAIPAGQGLKVLQTGLRFGANDLGSTGPGSGASEEELRHIIRDAGFKPVQRDALYRTMLLT
jgi:cyclic dehypoxanthinyl futalosine synthase